MWTHDSPGPGWVFGTILITPWSKRRTRSNMWSEKSLVRPTRPTRPKKDCLRKLQQSFAGAKRALKRGVEGFKHEGIWRLSSKITKSRVITNCDNRRVAKAYNLCGAPCAALGPEIISDAVAVSCAATWRHKGQNGQNILIYLRTFDNIWYDILLNVSFCLFVTPDFLWRLVLGIQRPRMQHSNIPSDGCAPALTSDQTKVGGGLAVRWQCVAGVVFRLRWSLARDGSSNRRDSNALGVQAKLAYHSYQQLPRLHKFRCNWRVLWEKDEHLIKEEECLWIGIEIGQESVLDSFRISFSDTSRHQTGIICQQLRKWRAEMDRRFEVRPFGCRNLCPLR